MKKTDYIPKHVVEYLRDSTHIAEACSAASKYHDGQWLVLYMVFCGFFAKWTFEDLEEASVQVARMARDIRESCDEAWYDSSYNWESAFDTAIDLCGEVLE